MEKTINAINARIAELEGYSYVLEELARLEKWHQHTSDEDENVWIDDDFDSAQRNLKAIRATMQAVKKLAGV